ncbi:MAG: NADH-quinone oxidoreductase subunit N [Nitrospirota bacterium]
MSALHTDLVMMLPHIVLAAGTVAALLAAAFARRNATVMYISVATLLCSFLSLGILTPHLPAGCTGLFYVDGVSAISTGLVLFASLCVCVLAYPYFTMHALPAREFSILLLLATLGCLVIVSSSHFASLFLGIELVGIPLVIMAAYRRGSPIGIEAGFKYLVLAGVSSAVLLFGMALLYAGSGSLVFGPALASLARPAMQTPLTHLGAALLIAGLGFKLALVPFHFWAPDVYQGAPAPVTLFVATASKAAVITALLRLFPPAVIDGDRYLFVLFAAFSVASMTVGNLLALRQQSIKRMFAYSSIAHSGYLLVAFLSAGPLAHTAIILYLVFYVVTNLCAFGVVSLLSGVGADADDLDDYAGLSWRKPWMAMVLILAVLSLLGIPLTAGFIAKFSVVAAGMASMHLALVLALAINTAVSAYYYLRIIMTMFIGPEDILSGEIRHSERRVPIIGAFVVSFQAALLLFIGIAPKYLLELIGRLVY